MVFRESRKLGRVTDALKRDPSVCGRSYLKIHRSCSISRCIYVVREKELRSAVSPLEKRRADSAPKAEALGVPRRHFLSLLLFLFAVSSLWAVDPSRHISQYAHTAWRIQDGVFSGTPFAVTQTTDGYLWIGTRSGLLRFDGVRFVPWTSPDGKYLPSSDIGSLLGARDGLSLIHI